MKLNNLCEYLDDKYHINHGGCCFIAYCISRMLEKDKIPFTVCVLGYREFPSMRSIDFGQNHYYLQIGNIDINYSECYCTELSNFSNVTSRMLLFHYNKYEWNDYYDFSNNLMIKKFIEASYNEFISSL